MKTTNPPKPAKTLQDWFAHIRRELKTTPCPDWSETKKPLPTQKIILS